MLQVQSPPTPNISTSSLQSGSIRSAGFSPHSFSASGSAPRESRNLNTTRLWNIKYEFVSNISNLTQNTSKYSQLMDAHLAMCGNPSLQAMWSGVQLSSSLCMMSAPYFTSSFTHSRFPESTASWMAAMPGDDQSNHRLNVRLRQSQLSEQLRVKFGDYGSRGRLCCVW